MVSAQGIIIGPRQLSLAFYGHLLTTMLQVAVAGAKTLFASNQSWVFVGYGHADSTKFLNTSQTIAANPLILRTIDYNSHKAFRLLGQAQWHQYVAIVGRRRSRIEISLRVSHGSIDSPTRVKMYLMAMRTRYR
jgi:hypothetical protein